MDLSRRPWPSGQWAAGHLENVLACTSERTTTYDFETGPTSLDEWRKVASRSLSLKNQAVHRFGWSNTEPLSIIEPPTAYWTAPRHVGLA